MKIFYAILIPLFSIPNILLASGNYTPLENIPGVTDGETTNLQTYFQNLPLVLIVVAINLAIIFIIIGGIQYVSTDALNDKKDGKQKIISAIGGLVLALGSYALLNTINPQVFNFDLPLGTAVSIQTPTNNNGSSGTVNIDLLAQNLDTHNPMVIERQFQNGVITPYCYTTTSESTTSGRRVCRSSEQECQTAMSERGDSNGETCSQLTTQEERANVYCLTRGPNDTPQCDFPGWATCEAARRQSDQRAGFNEEWACSERKVIRQYRVCFEKNTWRYSNGIRTGLSQKSKFCGNWFDIELESHQTDALNSCTSVRESQGGNEVTRTGNYAIENSNCDQSEAREIL